MQNLEHASQGSPQPISECTSPSTAHAQGKGVLGVMSLSLGSILSKIESNDDDNTGLIGVDEQRRKVDHMKKKSRLVKDRNESGSIMERRHSDKNDDLAVFGESEIALVNDQENIEMPKACWGTRHTLGFMGFLGVSCVYAMRVNLSVAIVAMSRTVPNNNTNSTDLIKVCVPPEGFEPDDEFNEDGEFDWDETTQGLILSVFFYGYLVTNLLGGRIAEIFGGKMVFGWGIFFTAIFTVLSPLCAKFSTGLFIAIRVLEGLSEGVIFPAMNSMLAKWIPPLERARFSSLVYAGGQFGTVVTMPVSGWLCDTDFLGGWPSVFYVFGGLGIIWAIGWYFLAYSHPDFHPRITAEEKAYIIGYCGSSKEKAIPIPWKNIITSLPFWAILVMHVGNNWGFYTLLTELPTYLKNIQHFKMTSNGIYSALPYLVMWIFSLVYSNVVNHLQASGKLSIIAVRRISMVIAAYGPMVGLVAMCFVDCDQVLAMVVLCVTVGVCGAAYSGHSCSHQDMAPNLAGTLMGLTNAAATIPGFVAPTITGLIITGNQTLKAWRTVFGISAAVYFAAGTFYLVFVSAEVQPWNFPKKDKIEGEEKKKKRY